MIRLTSKPLDYQPLLAAEREHRLLAETLNEINLALVSQTDSQAVLTEILRQVERLLPYKNAHIMLLNGVELRIGAWQGYQAWAGKHPIDCLVQRLSDLPIDIDAIQTRQPILVPDTEREPRWVKNEESFWVRAYLVVPICSKETVLGLLRIDSDEPGAFSEEDGCRLQPLATAAAIALEKATLLEQTQQELADRKQVEAELRRRNQQLELLERASQTFTSTQDLDQVLTTLLEGMRDFLKVSAWSVWLIDPDTNELVCRQATSASLLTPQGWRLPRGVGIAGWVTEHRQALIIPDTRLDPRHHPIVDQTLGLELRSILSLPLQVKDRVIGALQVVDERVGRFTEADSKLLEPLAANAALAIENARLFEQAQQEIANRHSIEQEIRRRNHELTLLNQIITTSAASLEPEPVLSTACRELGLNLQLSWVSVAILDPQKATVTIVAEYASGDQSSTLGLIWSLTDNPAWQESINNHRPFVIETGEVDAELEPISSFLKKHSLKSLLVVPLIANGEIIGFFNLGQAAWYNFDKELINLVQRVADQSASALRRIRLADTQRQLYTAIEQSPESIVITDVKGSIQYVNPAFERLTGYQASEAIGQNPRLLKSNKHDKDFYQEMWTTLKAGQVWQGRLINRRKDGSLYTEDVVISPVRDHQGVIVNYVAIKKDITEALKLENQYRQAQKMQAIGQLTGGIAHDFNNTLTAINGYAELLRLELPPDQIKLRNMVDRIWQAGNQASALIRQLMIFSRKQIVEPQLVDLNEVVEHTHKLLDRLIEAAIEIEIRLAKDLWPIKADPSQMEQVILNLAVNARDAMPEGGRLTIKTNNVVIDQTYSASHLGVEPGEFILLSVTDTGIGMSKEIQSQIFEPFFTTKPESQGTGLGLATVFGIVEQSGGHISVYSETGFGTTFKIYLPRSSEATGSTPSRPEVALLPRGAETILLVEDESDVRDLATRILQRQGYYVLTATHGQEALATAKKNQGPIHLLMTDAVMPKMGGVALIDQFKVLYPTTKILLTSGYTTMDMKIQDHLANEIAFLAKPFSASDLIHKVREVLEHTPPLTKF